MIRSSVATWATVGLAWVGVQYFDAGMGWIWGAYLITLPPVIISNWITFRRRVESPETVLSTEQVQQWLSDDEDDDGAIKGMAASPGIAEGRARVIVHADELGLVQEGEILVATITAPSWGPVFGKIRATVTDIGGMMSHAAIVCREYGLPAVTGTGSASTRIKTGMRLRVDGSQGIVTILE